MAGAVESRNTPDEHLELDLDFDFELDLDFDFDLDYLVKTFSDEGVDVLLDPSADLCVDNYPPPSNVSEDDKYDSPSGEPADDSDSVSSYVSHLEKFLMEEEEGEDDVAAEKGFAADDFFACLFAEASRDEGGEVATPDSEASKRTEREEEEEPPVAADGEDDDPVNKKRRRQIRNRDSAMKSRERKKMYVKELEMKSKYLEAECQRLDYVLRCCAAENMALHQRLQKERLYDAPTAKQESAVLFLESLLLGSLSWLVSIICLFLVPVLPNLSPKDINPLERGLMDEVVVVEKVTNKRLETNLRSGLVVFRKRCRALPIHLRVLPPRHLRSQLPSIATSGEEVGLEGHLRTA
ncbi:hypothetical protein OPV22_009283 [Ensete ventricosum]|uniref:BZIP domain-containing protein n=1 Tax=Ensete ventricosum TaxID=4639 RepID=A0AAV8RI40_ENSVE|nr:hypothetical protein OPV22_009283 [Ensete ventricosum]